MQQAADTLHQGRQVDRFVGQFLPAGKRQHALGQRNPTQCALGRVVQQLSEFRLVGQALAHDLQIAKDDRQQVIEIMSDAAGELADGLQFLGLEQCLTGLLEGLLGLGDIGDVAGDLGKAQQCASVAADRIDDHMSHEARAILAHAPALFSKRPSLAAMLNARCGSPVSRSSGV